MVTCCLREDSVYQKPGEMELSVGHSRRSGWDSPIRYHYCPTLQVGKDGQAPERFHTLGHLHVDLCNSYSKAMSFQDALFGVFC